MKTDAILLFSGGLDSILAAKILQVQGLEPLCLHFGSPFFGAPEKIEFWQNSFGLQIRFVDASLEFTQMLVNKPEHGFGKRLNPCIDCKILLLSLAKKFLLPTGAKFLATGEVIGQRPMSQRRDTLNLIQNRANVADLVLRPLCALHLKPIAEERTGLIDRSRLLDISGRGRERQLELARQFKLPFIPTPGGGCLLTEKENVSRYWQLLKNYYDNRQQTVAELAQDFRLANLGRQYFADSHWLCIGRNERDNEALRKFARPGDVVLQLADFPGPFALGRKGIAWPAELLRQAAALCASYSPKAVKSGKPVMVNTRSVNGQCQLEVMPNRNAPPWRSPDWDETLPQLRQFGKRPGTWLRQIAGTKSA